MRRLIILGGGISGLSAARAAVDRARGAGSPVEVTVLERDAAVGGKVRSLASDGGWLVEAGPTAYLDNEPDLDRVVTAAGLAGEKRVADPAAAHRFIVCGGVMREVAAHPLRFARSGLLGPLGLLRLACEPLVPGKRDGGDESVWDFACRRLGRQAAERLIGPMVLGVFAGDPRALSLAAAFPRIAALEREHGSLIRGMIRGRRQGLGGGPGGPSGELTSFDGGLETLPRTLAAAGDFAVRCRAEVVELRHGQTSWQVRTREQEHRADAVVLAGEAWSMAPLVRPFAPGLADRLDGIDYPPVSVVALGFGAGALARVPRGFGVLIPRGEGYRTLGVLWDSYLYPGRAPERHLLMRVMIGGAADREAGGLDEDGATALAEREVARLFGLDEPPVFRRAVRWPRAIPQYELGHLERVAAIERERQRLPGLFLASNYLHGIAFGKAASAGVAAGEAAVDWLECCGG